MSTKTILELKNISKHYSLGQYTVKAVDKVNLKLYQGEIISVIGPSGSGKSTLLNLMALLDQPTNGEIHFLNNKTTDYNEEESAHFRNQYVGFIFQQFNLLPKTTAVDNVLLPAIYNPEADLEEYRQKAIEILQDLGLGDRLKNQPNQLSGGQQQRVAIARSLINDPKIIFADEPTGNLDTESGKEVINVLKKLNEEGRTIVIVTHEKRLSKITNRRLHMLDGKITWEEKNNQ